MKIALLTGTFSHYSGIDRVVAQQAASLTAEGHDVTVVCFDGEMGKDKKYTVMNIGMPKSLFWQRVYRLFLFPLHRSKIAATMRRIGKQDTVYCHQYPLNALAEAMQHQWGTHYIYYNHGIPPAYTFSTWVEKTYITLFRWLTNRSLREPDEIISISSFLAEVCKKETGRVSRVIHDTVDKERFREAVSGDEVRQQLEINQAPMLLTVGRLSPHKGLHLLLSAFQKVRQQIPEAHLVIVGKATFEKYLAQLKRAAGPHTHFIGFVPDEDLPKFYSACDVYVSASQWEGFNLPVAEAQEFHKPVVAFSVGPHEEVFQGKGKLVPPGDVEEMASAIVKIIHQQREK